MAPRSQRRLPTSEELAIWRSHIETFDAVRSRIAAQLQRDSQLSNGDYRVLLALSEAEGGSMRSTRLAAHIEWERSRLSGHLGRMEKRGLVRREPCPDDARGSLVVLTDLGASTFHASTRPHLAAVKEIFVDAFTPDQLAQVSQISAIMRAHLGLDHAASSPADRVSHG